MKKLSSEIESQRGAIVTRLSESALALESTIDRINDQLSEAHDEFIAALAEYNDAVRDAEALRDEAVQSVQDYISERSEKWQEGERGQAYQAWADRFEELDLAEVEVEFPDAIESPFGDEGSGCAARVMDEDWQGEPER